MKRAILISFIISGILFFFACTKDEDTTSTQEATDAIEKISTSETVIEDAIEEANYEVDLFSSSQQLLDSYVANGNQWPNGYLNNEWAFGRRYRIHQCPEVTIVTEPGGYPKTVTLNYGEGTELNNGRILSGIIQYVITAPMFEDGSSRTVSYLDFAVDSLGISGSNVHLFSGDNETQRQFTITGTLNFTWSDGSGMTREVDMVREWIAGIETEFNPFDDVILISGTSTLTHTDGDIFFKEITDPLMKKGDCRWIVQGTVEFTKNNVLTAILDYGDGECDQYAILTYNGEDHQIIIGRKKWGNKK